MKLKSARLENFRCFDDITIEFHDRLTVLVGGNGSGKTAVLDALDGFLGNWAHFIDFQFKPHIFSFKSVKHNRDLMHFEYALGLHREKFQFKLGSTSLSFWQNVRFFLKAEVDNGDLLYRFKDSRQLKQLMDSDRDGSSLANYRFFTAKRINDNAFADALQWFADKEIEEAKTARRNKNMDYVIPELQAVREAISSALGDYEQPYTDKTPVELFIKKKGENTPYSIAQLSDGYRAMLVLIMDLAHHLAKTSAPDCAKAGTSVLESPAIVLIDEVELHLHPSWQQRVLPDLMRIFSNTQFIVTTHSPQVVSAIAHEHIRVLDGNHAYGVDEVTEGVDAGRILEEVFGVNPLPQNILWAAKLNTCRAVAFSEQWADALPLLAELEAHYGADYPPLYEMRLHVENRQWEREHEARA